MGTNRQNLVSVVSGDPFLKPRKIFLELLAETNLLLPSSETLTASSV